jgi:hypothetical protein
VTRPDSLRHHGDEVMVFDVKGNYELRGKIVGVNRCEPPIYDVQPDRAESLAKRICGIPESRLRSVSRPIRAYKRKLPGEPKHIFDEA